MYIKNAQSIASMEIVSKCYQYVSVSGGCNCYMASVGAVESCRKVNCAQLSQCQMFAKIFKSKTYKGIVQRPSKLHQQSQHNDQLPFLSRARFSALPPLQNVESRHSKENLSLFIAILYVIDMFGVFPFVTLPALLVRLGLLSIPLILSVVMLQIYTSFLLSRCWTMAESIDPSIVQKSRYPYAAIADLAYGRHLSLFVRVLLDIGIFAMSIPNIVVAAENLQLAGDRIANGHFHISYCYWVIIVGVFMSPLMWMGSPKHMRGLAILSVCVVIIVVALLWFCIISALPMGMEPFEGVSLKLPSAMTILNGYSVLAFQFDIHAMLLTLQIDMQQKELVGWAAFSGITATSTFAIIGSLMAAYKFGTMLAENVLETLPQSIPLIVLLILMSLQLCFSTIVGSSAMFHQIENFFKISEAFSYKRVLIRSLVVALELLIAEFVPNFDALMEIVGGTIIGPLVFIIPPLLYRRIRSMERAHQRVAVESAYGSIPLDLNYDYMDVNIVQPTKTYWYSKFLNKLVFCESWRCHLTFSLVVLIFGISVTFLSTFLNIFQMNELFKNNSPCFGSNFTLT